MPGVISPGLTVHTPRISQGARRCQRSAVLTQMGMRFQGWLTKDRGLDDKMMRMQLGSV